MTASSTFLATDGEGYERTMGRWSRRLAGPFLEFVGADDAQHVIDIGCGTGHLAGAAAVRMPCADVLGVDLSAAYLAHARSLYPDPRIRFTVGDACTLDAAPASFDAVLSMLVLHFVPRTTDAIAEMRRVAKPGAMVASAVWDARGGFVANRMFFDTAAAIDPDAVARRAKNYTRPMTRPGELAAAWREAGLMDVEETQIVIRMDFASFDDYWSPYIGQEGPAAEYVRSLHPEKRERLETAVRSSYLDGEADGLRSYAAIAWAVRGRA